MIKKIIEEIKDYLIWLARVLRNIMKGNLCIPRKCRLKIRESDELVILCNGPSLKKDIQKIQDMEKKDYMCVNFFPIKDSLFDELKPKYMCYIDSDFYDENLSNYVEMNKKINEKLFSSSREMIVFNYKFQKLIVKDNNTVKEYKVNYNVLDSEYYSKVKKFLFDYNIAIPVCNNVAVFALFNAIRLGYKKIYFAGLNMSFYKNICVDKDNNIIEEVIHYYGKDIKNLTEDTQGNITMKRLFEIWLSNYISFRILNEYAESHDVKVVNLTEDSYIDIFEKV